MSILHSHSYLEKLVSSRFAPGAVVVVVVVFVVEQETSEASTWGIQVRQAIDQKIQSHTLENRRLLFCLLQFIGNAGREPMMALKSLSQ